MLPKHYQQARKPSRPSPPSSVAAIEFRPPPFIPTAGEHTIEITSTFSFYFPSQSSLPSLVALATPSATPPASVNQR
jgi:hypothetical protein